MKLYMYGMLRKMVKYLQAQPEVDNVRWEHAGELHILFKDGLVEHWHIRNTSKITNWRCFNLSPSDLIIDDRFPEFRCEFTRNPLDDDYEFKSKYFKYTVKYLKSFCFCNQRLFLHRLAKQLEDEGFVNVWYTNDQIKSIYNKFNQVQWNLYRISNNVFSEVVAYNRWVIPIFLSSGVEFIVPGQWTRLYIMCALYKLYDKKPITRTSIIMMMKHLGHIDYDCGYIMSLVAVVKSFFPNSIIHNDTTLKWINASSIINNIVNGGDNVVTITDKIPNGGNNIIYIGELDQYANITLKNGYAEELHLTIINNQI